MYSKAPETNAESPVEQIIGSAKAPEAHTLVFDRTIKKSTAHCDAKPLPEGIQ